MTFVANPNPWKKAEDYVFSALCTSTGCTPKKNAFQGYLPPVGNVWALRVGGGGDVRNTWTAPITELRMDADIEAMFMERTRAQDFALQILQTLPIAGSNVQVFRLRTAGMPDLKWKEIRLANSQTETIVWAVTIGCEIVFSTT